MYDIKKRRLERGISQADLAESIGVSRSSIAKYEKGERTPTLSILQKIADVLKVSITDLGVDLPEGFENSKFISPNDFFSNMPYLADIFNGENDKIHNDNKSIIQKDNDILTEEKVRFMLTDCILFYFNEKDIYLSFSEMDNLFEEIKEYIYFKIYCYEKANDK